MTIQTGNPSERGGNGPAERPGFSSGAAASGASGASAPGSPLSGSTSTDASDWTRTDDTNRSEFGAFLDDLSELARGGHAPGELRSEIERRVSRARERMSDAIDQGRELSVRARDQMHRGIEYSRDAVTERPLSSVTIAAVGGLIVGLLLSRRH